jgi:hypothetical protein
MDLSRRQRHSKVSHAVFTAAALLMVAQALAIEPVFAQGFQQGQMASGQMSNQGQGNQNQGNQSQGGQNARPTDPAMIKDWFAKYDMVRRQAQMSPSERTGADDLLSHGLQVFVPGPEKVLAQKLLVNLVSKYDRACGQLKTLAFYPETSGLHRQYFQYFKDAKDLFSDYLRVQGNVMSKDQNGNSLFAGLMDRKQRLESTEQQAKALDGELRNRFGIAPYRF